MKAIRVLAHSLPKGEQLPDRVWQKRHGLIVKLIYLQVVALMGFGIAQGFEISHVTAEMSLVGLIGVLASLKGPSKVVRECIATLGLVACSAAIVHFSGGSIEAHFHFFLVVGVISLYQRWVPFLLAIGFTVAHHGILGVMVPTAVYSHPSAWANPWLWALIHGSAVLAASVLNIIAWRINIDDSAQDRLTGLGNGRMFMQRLEHALARGRRMGGTVAVLFIDLDGFKPVNDTLGHASGDRLLTEVGSRIECSLRESDTAARLGGDEFVVLLENGAIEEIDTIATRVLDSLTEPFLISNQEIFVGASVGVALADSTNPSAQMLVKCADAAMYAAKEKGSRVEFYRESLGAVEAENLKLQSDLRHALERRELSVVYQPIVDLSTGTTSCFEALLRWCSPTAGMISPATFIPIAERSGMIYEIGRWVLEEACLQATTWPTHGSITPSVSVNVSSRQLQRPEFHSDVIGALEAAGLPADRLVLEITESFLVENSKQVIDTLRKLKLFGVRFAVDDFGTGYSSISYLKQFPVDILKIDHSFTRIVDQTPEEAAITKAIIKLGHTFGLTIVAEGVESREQLAVLRRLGCELAQGFYFSRPVAPDAIASLLVRPSVAEWSRQVDLAPPQLAPASPARPGVVDSDAVRDSCTADVSVAGDHFVAFYESDSALVESVRAFLAEGLEGDEACLVVATSEHRYAIESRLREMGCDLTSAMEAGRYVSLDAREALSEFMIDNVPDRTRFTTLVGGLISAAASSGRRVRIFGEMVAVLWDDGNIVGAIELEEHWNHIAERHCFNLFCAYPTRAFAGAAAAGPFQHVCRVHNHVVPSVSVR